MQCLEKTIQISSINGLSIAVDGHCIAVHDWKSPKVYQLLTTLVALGGRNIPVGSIYDAMWSDVDGDKAVQNLEFILRRLRDTLQKKVSGRVKAIDIIQRHNGKISFNAEHCELDIWTWQALTEQARMCRKNGALIASRKIEQQAASMLTGEFLAGDDELALSPRMVWHTRFCNWIHEITDHWQHDKSVAHAEIITLLDVGLGISPCSEKLCMQRMNVLLDEGYRVDAMRAFKDWAMLVKGKYGISPSGKIHQVYTTVRQG